MRNPRLIFANDRTVTGMAAFNHTTNALRYICNTSNAGDRADILRSNPGRTPLPCKVRDLGNLDLRGRLALPIIVDSNHTNRSRLPVLPVWNHARPQTRSLPRRFGDLSALSRKLGASRWARRASRST